MEFEDDPQDRKSPRKQPSPLNMPSPKRRATRKSIISPQRRRSSVMDEFHMKMKEFERKSLLPYTEERTILILPSSYAVQFEKSGLHEKVFPLALQKENEIKMKYLNEIFMEIRSKYKKSVIEVINFKKITILLFLFFSMRTK